MQAHLDLHDLHMSKGSFVARNITDFDLIDHEGWIINCVEVQYISIDIGSYDLLVSS